MFPLFETIRFDDGRAGIWSYHASRLYSSCLKLYGIPPAFDPEKAIEVPEACRMGVWKCRLLYNASACMVEWQPYVKRALKRLIVKDSENLDYQLKYTDRSALDGFGPGLGDDEEVLLVRNGLVTDTRYTNVALFDGLSWITPEHPLLPGTRRMELLDFNIIRQGVVKMTDLRASEESKESLYDRIRLFNAMIPWEEAIELPIECVQTKIQQDD